jgi:hypothetical protein
MTRLQIQLRGWKFLLRVLASSGKVLYLHFVHSQVRIIIRIWICNRIRIPNRIRISNRIWICKWIRIRNLYYSFFSGCGKSGTIPLRTARVTLTLSAISQSCVMRALHLGDSLDLWHLAVKTSKRVLATQLLVVRTWAVPKHCTPICLRRNLNWKPSYSKIRRIWLPTFTLMGALLYGP